MFSKWNSACAKKPAKGLIYMNSVREVIPWASVIFLMEASCTSSELQRGEPQNGFTKNR